MMIGSPEDKKKSAKVGKVIINALKWACEREEEPDWPQGVGETWQMD